MAARIDDVLAIDDVDHVDDAGHHIVVNGAARTISGIEKRHFTFFMECQFVDDEQLELLLHPGHTGFAFAYRRSGSRALPR
jgi:hypothetical protein